MNYYQRHFMQHLRGGNWVNISALPDSPSTKVKVVKFGWVERRVVAQRPVIVSPKAVLRLSERRYL